MDTQWYMQRVLSRRRLTSLIMRPTWVDCRALMCGTPSLLVSPLLSWLSVHAFHAAASRRCLLFVDNGRGLHQGCCVVVVSLLASACAAAELTGH
jgi:hypothetical protein